MGPKGKNNFNTSITSSALLRDLEGMEIASLNELMNQPDQANAIANQQSPRGEFLQPQRATSYPTLFTGNDSMSGNDLPTYSQPQMIHTSVSFNNNQLGLVRGSGDSARQQVLDAFEFMESQRDNPQILKMDLTMATLVGSGMVGAGKGDAQKNVDFIAAIQAIQIQQQIAAGSSSRKPATNVYRKVLWPVISYFQDITSTQLQVAVIMASDRGCKVCAGFGHGHSKCITSQKLKYYGKGIPIVRAIYHKVLKEFLPNGDLYSDSFWHLRFNIEAEFKKAMKANAGQGSDAAKGRLKQLTYHEKTAIGTLAALEKFRCAVCFGWGHIASQKIRLEPKGEKQQLYCQTLQTIDEAVQSDALALQEWIKLKRELTPSLADGSSFRIYGEQNTAKQFIFPANPGKTGARADVTEYVWFVLLVSMYMTIYMLYHNKADAAQGNLLNYVYRVYNQSTIITGEIVKTAYDNFNLSEVANVVPKALNDVPTAVAAGKKTIGQLHDEIIKRLEVFVDNKVDNAGALFDKVAKNQFANFIFNGEPLNKVFEASVAQQEVWKQV